VCVREEEEEEEMEEGERQKGVLKSERVETWNRGGGGEGSFINCERLLALVE
jgi:hypothetical protein